ncbi:hypothetical protein C8R44DRAFT_606993 [Mycena epipterygia]|nr:hypothetical protein C8R44DRAFT_606993 [Mycena epipterygia]
MVKCLNKYGISFETIHPSTTIQREMPLWHHPGEDRRKRQDNNGEKAKCLRQNHAALTIGAGVDIAQRLENPLHAKRATCTCDECDQDRTTRGCSNPHACAMAAASRLRQILPKWIPEARGVDGPTDETSEQGANTERFLAPDGITNLAQGIRAMTL